MTPRVNRLQMLAIAVLVPCLAHGAAAAEVVVAKSSAGLAYELAAHSPLLGPAERRAISQDFHGAPLAGSARMHQVVADRVHCRVPTPKVGGRARCTIDYSAGKAISLVGASAKSLFDAMGKAGVEAEGGMSHEERALTALVCLVDDKTAQETPSSGDEIAGFSCKFSTQ